MSFYAYMCNSNSPGLKMKGICEGKMELAAFKKKISISHVDILPRKT